jgi:hypothetical protein
MKNGAGKASIKVDFNTPMLGKGNLQKKATNPEDVGSQGKPDRTM